MKFKRSDLEKIDLGHLKPFVAGPNANDFFNPREHYRLLAALSSFIHPSETIVDIGTCYGDSALALSYSGHRIESFDVADLVGERALPSTVHRHQADLFDPTIREARAQTLLDSGLILIDIAPHAGTQELEMVRWLQANSYQGLIVLDDIWWYKEMRDNLWYRIEPRYRTDVTAFGHWSGSGIVSFAGRVEHEEEPNTDNWTLVTGYFDLTKMPDASDALRARTADWYINQHGSSVLSLDKNLVVFCEPEFEARIWSARPEWLHRRTRVVPMSFEDFPLTHHREKIIKNRDGSLLCPSDPRATASYYLFCMARYAMMKSAIHFNTFNSTHFAWIDMGIERMGFNNLIYLDEALSVRRDRFSTCFIDYVSRDLVADLPVDFGGKTCFGRCSMASGFFTGNAKYMREVCDEIESAFLNCLGAGFGHADEQLYPIVYFKRPELFDWYCGDYTEVITNYAGVREHPESPIRNLIRNSLAAGDHEVCRRACDIVLYSHINGRCVLGTDDLDALMRAQEACA